MSNSSAPEHNFPLPFSIRIEEAGDHRLVQVEGEIDLATIDELRAAIESARGDVTLDLTEVSFLDSSALALLVEAHLAVSDRGNRFVISNPQPVVTRFLKLAGLSDRLEIAASGQSSGAHQSE